MRSSRLSGRWHPPPLASLPFGLLVLSCLLPSPEICVAQCGPDGPLVHQRPERAGPALYDLWGDGTDLYAVGNAGTILRYDGNVWQDMPSGTAVPLRAVDGSGPANIWAVGDGGTALHYDGVQWSSVTTGVTERLNGVWANAGNVVAAGLGGRILRYDGNAWIAEQVLDAVFQDVWGTSEDRVFAAGLKLDVSELVIRERPFIVRYDGTQWITAYYQGLGNIASVWGAGSNDADVFFLRSDGQLGSLGTPVDLRLNTGAALWGFSPTDLVALGLGGLVATGGGSSWALTGDVRIFRTTRALWGDDAGNAYIADDWGSVFRYDGNSFEVLRGGDLSNDIYDVHGSASDDVYAVTDRSTMLRFDGSDWASFPPPTKPGGGHPQLFRVHAFGPDDVFVASGSTTDFVYRWDGVSWTQLPIPSFPTVQATGVDGMWGYGTGSIVVSVVEATGYFDNWVYRFDGNSWDLLFTRTDSAYHLYDMWAAADDDIYFVTANRDVIHWDGVGLSTVATLPGSGTLFWVSGSGPDNVWAVGFEAVAFHYDGSSWTTVPGLPGTHPSALWVSPTGIPFVCTNHNAEIVWYDGSSWQTLDDEPMADHIGFTLTWGYRSIWGADDCSLFAAGEYGVIHQRPGIPTPVLFQDVEARALGTGNELRWTVWTDEGLQGYHVYRHAPDVSSAMRLTSDAPLSADAVSYLDRNVEPGREYAYFVAAVRADGSEIRSPDVRVTAASPVFGLETNHPNPFNPSTTIRFSPVPGQPTTLRVYDVEGRPVVTLWQGRPDLGVMEVQWNGTDANGNRVASGVYICTLVSGGKTASQKMVLLK